MSKLKIMESEISKRTSGYPSLGMDVSLASFYEESEMIEVALRVTFFTDKNPRSGHIIAIFEVKEAPSLSKASLAFSEPKSLGSHPMPSSLLISIIKLYGILMAECPPSSLTRILLDTSEPEKFFSDFLLKSSSQDFSLMSALLKDACRESLKAIKELDL